MPEPINLHLVKTLEDALALKRWLGERRPDNWIAVDTESGGLDWWRDRLRTVQFGDAHDGWCVEWSEWAGLIKECLNAYEGPMGYWNIKHDLHFTEHNGISIKRGWSYDGRAMMHLQDPVRRTGLKPVAARVLGPWATYGEEEMKLAMQRGGYTYDTIPIDLLWQYAAFDTVITAQTIQQIWPGIVRRYAGIYDLELASTFVLTDMERRGILTDREWMVKHADQWASESERIKIELRRYYIGNPASDREVEKALRDQLGWQPTEFTDKGAASMERHVLQGIGHEIADLVLEYRANTKMLQYVKQHLELAGPDGRLHCSINPLGARTGRMSASRPNLQNIPRDDTRIRGGFIAEEGHVLISADFDQIEGRLFAHYSGDQKMLASIRYGDQMKAAGHDGYDMHSMAARIVFGIGADQPVPKKLRSQTKTVQFGKIYGSGLDKFMAISGISVSDDARRVIAKYEEEFPETRKDGFQSRVTKRLIERERSEGEGYVLTAFGRKEPCWPSKAYKAVNYLIQGTAADVMKERMVALSRTWVGEHMLLPIHDELLFSVPEDAAYEAVRTIREVMPERTRFAVPLTVDVEVMRRWGDEPLAMPAAA